jgi:hypothetical protein
MFIETKFYDNGKATAKLHNCEEEPALIESGSYDVYIEYIEDLQEWIEDNLCIETDDIIDFVITLDSGAWTDMTNYI